MLGSCIVRPGEPAIMLAEALPLPAPADETRTVAGDRARASQRCEEPLELFSISADGAAAAHADHSAPLRGEAGEPIEVALELSWRTDGEPYQWRHSTRYEIPCRVEGSVRIGGQSFEIDGPGQRDHSWGARDWWASDWTWSALHLDDGTHTHAVSVPAHPNFAVGYIQRDGELTELTRAGSTERVRDDGLVENAAIEMSPGDLEIELEPIGFGAVRLEADDGRVTHFPRAACRVRAADGREGLGWVEWNRNQPPAAGPVS